MTVAEYITLDPEFEELLREVASDPNSSLLRVPRPKRIRSLFDRSAPVGPMEPGLSAAERQLVRVHRNQLAWLLREACLVKLLDGPTSKWNVARFRSAHEECQLMRPAEMAEQLRLERRFARGHGATESAFALLEQCTTEGSIDTPSVVELASASFRLERTDEARILVAVDCVQSNAIHSAIRISWTALSDCRQPREVLRCWQVLSSAYARMRRHDLALASQVTGCAACPDDVWGQLNLLVLALQAGNKDLAITASQALEDVIPSDHALLRWAIEAISTRRGQHEWTPTHDGAQLAARLQGKLGAAGDTITHVFL